MTVPPITREEREAFKRLANRRAVFDEADWEGSIASYETALAAEEAVVADLRAENERLREAVNALDHALDRSLYFRTMEASAVDEIDVTRRRARAYLKGAPVSPWRDIATAPKDGTYILVFPALLGAPLVATWERSGKVPSEGIGHLGFWRAALTDELTPYQPTHWMPLPPPPSQEGENG